jgi:hypothetical protein
MSESAAEPDATAAGETDETAEPEVFENRAARRSKGKKAGPTEVFTKGQPPVGRGSSVQSPRQYGNRRSG